MVGRFYGPEPSLMDGACQIPAPARVQQNKCLDDVDQSSDVDNSWDGDSHDDFRAARWCPRRSDTDASSVKSFVRSVDATERTTTTVCFGC